MPMMMDVLAVLSLAVVLDCSAGFDSPCHSWDCQALIQLKTLNMRSAVTQRSRAWLSYAMHWAWMSKENLEQTVEEAVHKAQTDICRWEQQSTRFSPTLIKAVTNLLCVLKMCRLLFIFFLTSVFIEITVCNLHWGCFILLLQFLFIIGHFCSTDVTLCFIVDNQFFYADILININAVTFLHCTCI